MNNWINDVPLHLAIKEHQKELALNGIGCGIDGILVLSFLHNENCS